MTVIHLQPKDAMAQPANDGERIATLEAWSEQHEARCSERMEGITSMFEKIEARFNRAEAAGWTLAVAVIGFLAVKLGEVAGLW